MEDRRTYLQRLAVVGAVAQAGCIGESGTGEPTGAPTTSPASTPTATAEPTETPTGAGIVDVAAGPEGRLRFVPETVEILVGETVRWTFESAGHNVTSLPGASEKVRNPEGAEPFASYEGTQHFAINDVGTTFEHTFDVPGEYVYVCAPHAGQGMVGTVIVSEDDEE
ncbi:plastocyanin/azurin family copper-binding protein [Haloarchaeobius baliensis]|uniref:plastocyanin/azurin family copper-binding protein n=1 Tax=Haloarchaeobius baliensis TaxID=1670458 RepID=UPI003F885A99